MESLSIILIVVCAVLLAVLLWILIRNGKKPDLSEEFATLNELVSEKEREISRLRDNTKNEVKKSEEIITQQKEVITQQEETITQLRESNLKELEESAAKIKELEAEISKAISEGTDEVVRKKLAEVDKLLKKVRNLENELDETQDEIDDLTKKNKKLQSENSSLNESIENEIRKGKRLIEEIGEVKARLEEVEKEFAVRQEALDFVKEILTAKRTSDTSVQALFQIVDSIVDYIKGDVRDCLTSIYDLTSEQKNEIFGSELISWAISKKKSWIQGKTTIAFVGEFSAGKTSIVNRILSQDNPDVPRLPVSTKATTAIPTYISGGVSTYYQFVTPDNELKGISEDTFKRVNKEVLDQVKGVSSLIQYFVMTYKNPNLDRLSILDTPGFNSNDSEDAERTIGVINECDALFWVFDVNSGTVNRSSINIIKKHLTKPLYIVINQIDTKSKSDVDAVEQLIRKTLGEAGVAIKGVIRFSKKEPLDKIMTPILSIPHDNSREGYLDDLISSVSNLVKDLAKDTNEAQKKSHSLENKSKKLVDAYVRAISSLTDDCVAVRDIPQLNERWFTKDDYRISQEQYSEFKDLLRQIAEDHTSTLCEKYDEQMETVRELETSWGAYYEAKNNQKRVDECLSTLRKRANQLSNINSGYRESYSNHIIQSGIVEDTEKSVRQNSTGSSKGRKKTTQSSPISTNTSKQTGSGKNATQAIPDSVVGDFLSYFKWTIIEQDGNMVKINWTLMVEQLRNITGKYVSTNGMRKEYSMFGIKDWVSLSDLSLNIMNYINK